MKCRSECVYIKCMFDNKKTRNTNNSKTFFCRSTKWWAWLHHRYFQEACRLV